MGLNIFALLPRLDLEGTKIMINDTSKMGVMGIGQAKQPTNDVSARGGARQGPDVQASSGQPRAQLDGVTLTEQSKRLQAMESDSSERFETPNQARIDEVRTAIMQGNYPVDADALSQSIMELELGLFMPQGAV